MLLDGISASHPSQTRISADRIRSNGGVITTSESILFELLRDAKDEKFKEFLKLLKQFQQSSSV